MKFFKKKNIKYSLRFIGLVLLIIVLSRINRDYLIKSLKNISLISLFMTIPFFISIIIIKSLRWIYILKIQHMSIKISRAFNYYTSAIYWGLVTPGRLGEFIKIYYLKKTGVSSGKALLSVLIDRGVDIFFLMMLSIAGIMLIFNCFSWILFGFIIITAVLITLLILKNIDFILKRFKFISSLFSIKFREKGKKVIKDFKKDLLLFTSMKWFIIIAITIFSWILYVIPLYMLGTMLHIHISFVKMIIAILLSSAIAMLPISIGGIGTRDFFLIFYLGQEGILKEKVLIFSFMFIYMNLVAMLFSYIIYMFSDINHHISGKTDEY